ncbi:MAG: DsbA family protein [Candidatus Omnitrophica bacterium]|nr:DsbA family protein [Candidatus Omnitrophota bacterium]
MFLRVVLSVFLILTLFPLNGFAKKKSKDVFRFPVDIKESPVQGNPKAPVTIVEVSDFQCPFCGMVQPTLKQIQERYPNEVKLSFKHFPLSMHPDAELAHSASLCAAGQDKFWEMRSILFENQRALKRDDLIRYANQLGLEAESFTKCLDEGKYLSKIEEDREEILQYGIQGTPAFYVNGRLLSGAQPYGAFEEIIEDELKRFKS